MKITEAELALRKEQIIHAAFKLFCKYGIEKVTIKDIAKAAKLSESSIYRYYENKANLVLATLSILWQEIGSELEKNAEATPHYNEMNGYEQISVWLDGMQMLYQENAAYVMFSYESKLYLQRNGIRLSKATYNRLMADIEAPFIAAIEKGKADGSIPVDVDSVDLFYAIWGNVRGYVVKIVIYEALCEDGGPWTSRYDLVKEGILSALSVGWHPKDSFKI